MKILSKLKYAAPIVNGVKFAEHKLGMLSEEVSDEVGAALLRVNGFIEYVERKPAATKATTPATPAPAAPAPAPTPAAAPAPAAAADAAVAPADKVADTPAK